MDPGRCYWSHDPAVVEAWDWSRRNMCHREASCKNLAIGNCLYRHSEDVVESVRRNSRPYLIMIGLGHQSLLDLSSTSLGAGISRVYLKNEQSLSSFNLLPSGQSGQDIVIPGKNPQIQPHGYSNIILTPAGVPARLRPLKNRKILRPDSSDASTPAYIPYRHKFEPLARAISVSSPHYNLLSADIVTTAGSLVRLFCLCGGASPGWLRGQRWGGSDRLDLELVGKTLFIFKWENQDNDLNYRHFSGYGHTFERETCKYEKPFQESSNHSRVVGYKLGNLQFVVQSEVDGYHCECHTKIKAPVMSVNTPAKGRAATLNMFENLTLDDPGDTTANKSPPALGQQQSGTPTPLGPVTISHGGRSIPGACLVEVKTAIRESPREPEAQLYFARRKQLYHAEYTRQQHAGGDLACFSPGASVEPMSAKLDMWERKNEQVLAKLIKLLAVVRRRMEGSAGKRAVSKAAIIWKTLDGGMTAQLYQRTDGHPVLPSDMYCS